jgi:hypothetical protein
MAAAVRATPAVPAAAVTHLDDLGLGCARKRRGRHGLDAESRQREQSRDRGKQGELFAHAVSP